VRLTNTGPEEHTILLAIALVVYVPAIRQEEDCLRRMHGEAFTRYASQAPSFLPRLRPAKVDGDGVRQSRFEWAWVWRNKEHRTWVGLVVLFGLLVLRG